MIYNELSPKNHRDNDKMRDFRILFIPKLEYLVIHPVIYCEIWSCAVIVK